MPNPIVYLQSLLEPIEELIPNEYLAEFVIAFLEISILLALTTFFLNLARQILHQKNHDKILQAEGIKGAISGAVLGSLTPVCSCSVSGIYAGLLNSGASKTASTAFLFAAPAVNEFAIVAMLKFAGIVGTIIYIFFGLTAAIATGLFHKKLNIRLNKNDLLENHSHSHNLKEALKNSLFITKKTYLTLLLPIIIGVILSLLIKQLLPEIDSSIQTIGDHWYSPVLATLFGLPMHIEASSAISILLPVLSAGLPLGTGISLLMSTTISSVSEVAILPKIIGKTATFRLVAWYFVYCSTVGILINTLLPQVGA